jgi:transcriptional regulator with XRE-family HTH domain
MQRAGVTQEQVAEACGVSGPAVNQWLTGKTRNVDPRYLADVAAGTNASLSWLMTGRGDPGRRARDPLSPAARGPQEVPAEGARRGGAA